MGVETILSHTMLPWGVHGSGVAMHEGIESLSGREIEVLRLLLAGHDAKSVARDLGLSVHTVNDRLRDARRKLGVSSSREAARILADAEHKNPEFYADKKIGVSGGLQGARQAGTGGYGHHFSAGKKMGLAGPALLPDSEQASGRQAVRGSLVWLAGGVVVITMIVATLLPTSPFRGGGEVPVPADSASAAGQPVLDLMPIADTDRDGKVTADEYEAFSEQGWDFVSQGKDRVRWAELDQMAQVSFVGIAPNAEGVITRQMYIDAIPGRFRMFDQNGDGTLSSDEINGRAFQR